MCWAAAGTPRSFEVVRRRAEVYAADAVREKRAGARRMTQFAVPVCRVESYG